jgi:hypothetical protein
MFAEGHVEIEEPAFTTSLATLVQAVTIRGLRLDHDVLMTRNREVSIYHFKQYEYEYQNMNFRDIIEK